MGITGLLPKLEPLFDKEYHVERLKGSTVAVDASCWLHKASYGCAWDIALGNPTTRYLNYCMHRVNMLKHYGVKPVLVFDGRELALKRDLNRTRSAERTKSLEKGMEFHRQWRLCSAGAERDQLFQKALFSFQHASIVTPEMTAALIRNLDESDVQHVTAPYEADVQCVHLVKSGKCQAVISEDSDIIVFGMAAQVEFPLLTKLDEFGSCKMIRVLHPAKWACRYNGLKENSENNKPRKRGGQFLANLSEMTWRDFVQICVLSGCDYLPSIPGVGLAKAQQLVMEFQTVPPNDRVCMILEAIRDPPPKRSRKSKKKAATKSKATPKSPVASLRTSIIPVDYVKKFAVVEAVFFHQPVIEDTNHQICHLQALDMAPAIEVLRRYPKHVKRIQSSMFRDGWTFNVFGEDYAMTMDERNIPKLLYTGKICPKTLQPWDETLAPLSNELTAQELDDGQNFTIASFQQVQPVRKSASLAAPSARPTMHLSGVVRSILDDSAARTCKTEPDVLPDYMQPTTPEDSRPARFALQPPRKPTSHKQEPSEDTRAGSLKNLFSRAVACSPGTSQDGSTGRRIKSEEKSDKRRRALNVFVKKENSDCAQTREASPEPTQRVFVGGKRTVPQEIDLTSDSPMKSVVSARSVKVVKLGHFTRTAPQSNTNYAPMQQRGRRKQRSGSLLAFGFRREGQK